MTSQLYELWRCIGPLRKRQLTFLLLLMVFTSCAEAVSIGSVIPFLGVLTETERIYEHPAARFFIQALDLTQSQQLILPVTALFIVTIIVATVSRVALLWFQTKLGHKIGADLSAEIYRRTLHQPYLVHLSRNSSEIITVLSTKINIVTSKIILSFLNVVNSIIMLSVIVALLVYIEPEIAILTFSGFSIFYAIITVATKKQLSINSNVIAQSSIKAIKTLQEGLGAIKDILIDGTQKTYHETYRAADGALRSAQAKNLIVAGMPRFAIEALTMILIALIAYRVSYEGQSLSDSIPILGALALGAQRLLPVMQQMYSGWSSINGELASLREVIALRNQRLPDYSCKRVNRQLSFERSLALRDVTFGYKTEDQNILNRVNIEIYKGSRVGFIGSTGSGKSTLLDILMGLLPPKIGALEVDGIRVTEKNCHYWQANIAHVPQSIYLADLSILENIAFVSTSERIDIPRVKQAAEAAQISETIESWECGYETLVGERGIRLSGGQRQRIGIARALYKKASLIVLDEATSALDSETERSVMESINSLGREITILIVAHRPSTLDSCDMLFEVSRGGVTKLN